MGRELAGAALVNLALGSLFAWSVFVEPVRATFEASTAQLSAVFSTALVVFTTVVLAAGALADRTAPRLLVGACALLAGAGLGLSALAGSLVVLLAGYGVLFGIANGLGYVTALAVANRVGGRQRGLAVGVAVAAYAAGPVLVGPLAGVGLAHLGWRSTFGILAAGLVVTLLGAAALLWATPEAGERRAGGQSGTSLGLVLLWGVFLFGTAPALLAFAHAATLMQERGAPQSLAGLGVALLAAGNLGGRAGAGALSDRVGRPPALHASLAGLAVGCGLLGWTGGGAGGLVGLGLVGLSYGAQASLIPAATADLVGPSVFGASFGRVFTGWGAAGLAGPAVGAAIRDTAGSYAPAFQLSLFTVLLGVVLVALLPTRTR